MDELKNQCCTFMKTRFQDSRNDEPLLPKFFSLASQYLLKDVLKVLIPKMIYFTNISYENVLRLCNAHSIPATITMICANVIAQKFKHVIKYRNHRVHDAGRIYCEFCSSNGLGFECGFCNFYLCSTCRRQGKNAGLQCPYISMVCKNCEGAFCTCFEDLLDTFVDAL